MRGAIRAVLIVQSFGRTKLRNTKPATKGGLYIRREKLPNGISIRRAE
jgi:hypothetical protein